MISVQAFAQNDAVIQDVVAPSSNNPSTSGNSNPFSNNEINNATGKVSFSVPIRNIQSKSLSYPIALNYNGKSSFDQGQYLNEYKPSGILGVGWGIKRNRIVANNKDTGSRDDDEFFVQGDFNTRLICTNKVEPDDFEEGLAYWEFKSEEFSLTKFRYIRYERYLDLNNGYQNSPRDYWIITDENGVTHTYGGSANSKEVVLAWGNWIGDSNNPNNSSLYTIVWNISEIKDQWNDFIQFSYLKQNRKLNSYGNEHTEASYLETVKAATGEEVKFVYGEKTSNEFYEPHTEAVEPDAYQERYERKYLNKIELKDRNATTFNTYELNYDLHWHELNDRKRYLRGVLRRDNNDNTLLNENYEYYLSGEFEGGIKKVSSTQGGHKEYFYDNKYVFTNNNTISIDGAISSQYTSTAGRYVGDNYSLRLEYIGNGSIPSGNHSFRILRDYWDGKKWIRSQQLLNEQISFDTHNNTARLDNARFIFSENFYAALVYNRSNNRGYLYLTHLSQDGKSWIDTKFSNIDLGSLDNDQRDKDPVLIQGDDFVAIGTSRIGKLHKYRWNGNGWRSRTTNFGSGQYYYGANNNFVLVLDEDGGVDAITDISYPDNYYIEYLDATKKWNTKSWSQSLNYWLNSIEKPSAFFPSNSMTGFVADDNPEVVLRWDSDYNIIAADDEVGQYDDTWPFIPVGNNMFVIHELLNFGNLHPKKAIAFNGSNWREKNFSNAAGTGLFVNKSLTQVLNNGNYQIALNQYNPNSHNWLSTITLPNAASNLYQTGAYSFGNKIFMAGHYLYKLENNGNSNLGLVNNYDRTIFSTTGGGEYIYAEYKNNNFNPTKIQEGHIYYINKKTGDLNNFQVRFANDDQIHTYLNRRASQFGGNSPFFSGTTFITDNGSFKRLLDYNSDQHIYEIVVNKIIQNDGGQNNYSTTYNYSNGYPDLQNNSVFFKEVIVNNRGENNSTVGKIKYTYNNGEFDSQKSGLLLIKETLDTDDDLVEIIENKYSKHFANVFNSSNNIIGRNYSIRNYETIEKQYYENRILENTLTTTFNGSGLPEKTMHLDSSGNLEEEITEYAYYDSQFSFLNDANMKLYPHRIIGKVNGSIVSIKESEWLENENSKIYLSKTSSGVSNNSIRPDNQVHKIDQKGNILEFSNAIGIYNTALMGNNDINEVVSISNARYQDVINQLDVTYSQLQNLSNLELETELVKLYNRLPNSMISISLFDSQGRIVKTFDNRENVRYYHYDGFGRLDYVTDKNLKILEKREYYIDN